MKYKLISIVVLLLAPLEALHAADTSVKKPNVILLVVDDLGYADVSCLANQGYRTFITLICSKNCFEDSVLSIYREFFTIESNFFSMEVSCLRRERASRRKTAAISWALPRRIRLLSSAKVPSRDQCREISIPMAAEVLGQSLHRRRKADDENTTSCESLPRTSRSPASLKSF